MTHFRTFSSLLHILFDSIWFFIEIYPIFRCFHVFRHFISNLKRIHKKGKNRTESRFMYFTIFLFRIRLLDDFLEMFESFFTILFVWSLGTICGALLMIQLLIVQYNIQYYISIFKLNVILFLNI